MTDKTIADVLDKSIDKLSGGAAEIAKAAKAAAPHAWEVAVRRQVIVGITDLLLQLCAVALIVWMVRISRRVLAARDWKLGDLDDGPNAAFWACTVTAILGIVVATWIIGEEPRPINRLLAPEYYTAVDLIDELRP